MRKKKVRDLGFPGSSVERNLPPSVGDMGLIPVPGRFHTQWNN